MERENIVFIFHVVFLIISVLQPWFQLLIGNWALSVVVLTSEGVTVKKFYR